MKIKIKKLHIDAVIPKYAKKSDAGLDLTATSYAYEIATDCEVYGTGLAMEIPEGHVGLIFPRSSLSKMNLILSNHVGVIDSGYRGEVSFKFKKLNIDEPSKRYEVGERIGQLIVMPIPEIGFEEVGELSDSERGTGGYGSSGK